MKAIEENSTTEPHNSSIGSDSSQPVQNTILSVENPVRFLTNPNPFQHNVQSIRPNGMYIQPTVQILSNRYYVNANEDVESSVESYSPPYTPVKSSRYNENVTPFKSEKDCD